MGINQRVSLRRFMEDVRRWVEEGRSDEWIASALGTTPSSVQSFRSRNGIYRSHSHASLPDQFREPVDYGLYEGVVEAGEKTGIWFDPIVSDDPRWKGRWESASRVDLYLTENRIVLLAREEPGLERGARRA